MWYDIYRPRHYEIEPGARPNKDISTVELSWRVQNFVVVGRVYFELEPCKFWSNFEFDRNIVSGTGAR